MRTLSIRTILIAAAAALMLASLAAQAGPDRARLLAGHERGDAHGRGRHHQSPRHHESRYRQHRYASARRYAATAVRQARQARQLGYYPNHPRWSMSFQRHFHWALNADDYRIERETRRRARKLRDLRRQARHAYGYPY